MGQRLVVGINKGDKTLCNIYYHWSGYTIDALSELNEIKKCLYWNNRNPNDYSDEENILRLIRMCELRGGGIGGDCDIAYVQKMFPEEVFKTENVNRNYGLIAVSEKDIGSYSKWAEEIADLDIETGQVDFCCVYTFDDYDHFVENRKEWLEDDYEEIKYEDIPKLNYEIGIFNIKQTFAILEALRGIQGEYFRTGDLIHEFI